MVAPLTPNEIRDAMKAWGIPFIEESGWERRGNGQGWGDVAGFMWHHTGDDAPDSADLRVVRDGRPGLSGPLSQFGLRDDGKVHLIAAGAANHAGGGDPAVLSAVRAESYGAIPPAPRYIHGQSGSVIGNPVFYGVESFYYRNLTGAARRMMPRLAAAIIWALDRKDTKNAWTAKSAIGHREWQRGKIDPRLDGGDTCATLRAETQALLNAGPSGTDKPKEWDEMASKDEIKAAVREVMTDPKTAASLLGNYQLTTGKPGPDGKPVYVGFPAFVRYTLPGMVAGAVAAALGQQNGQPLTSEQITAAAEAGTRAALDDLLSANVDVNLTPKESA